MFDGGLGALVLQAPRLPHVSVVCIGLVHLVSRPFLACKNGRGKKLLGRCIREKGPFDRCAGDGERMFALVGWGETRVGVFFTEDAAAVLDGTQWHLGRLHAGVCSGQAIVGKRRCRCPERRKIHAAAGKRSLGFAVDVHENGARQIRRELAMDEDRSGLGRMPFGAQGRAKQKTVASMGIAYSPY